MIQRAAPSRVPLAVPTLFSMAILFSDSTGAPVRKPPPSQDVIDRLPADGGEEFNRLVFEKSPYLLQHARNPVDWFPWGDEAFKKAAEENKPVLLSVGYTTCHWCHVMEHESFEDAEVARLMNEWFIPVKVDREERPDIDEVYMTVTQAMTGQGGWPMTVVMTPDKRPFFAGTYFPKDDRGGRPGFKSLMKRLHEAWTDEPGRIEEVADNIKNALGEMVGGSPGEALGVEELQMAFLQLKQRFDSEHGGFGAAPKFPTPPILSFLLRYWKRTGEEEALRMVEKTLQAMRLGGVYDHVGFGTHRYSTDKEWLLPHFEKMLYDQALLAIAHTETFQVTGDPVYRTVADEIFTYVLRDMTGEEGGFFSAEDADSEGEEGIFYVWTPEEVINVLGAEDGALFNEVYGIVPGGNFLEEAKGTKTGDSIPHLKKPLEEIAREKGEEVGAFEQKMEVARAKLFSHREKRIHPQKDDKVLTDWNGLMIAALAKAGQAFNEPRYTTAAQRAADFLLETLRGEDGELLKRYRGGEAGLTAHLEDYAFAVWGLIELYEATFETRYLREAIALTEVTLEKFWDDDQGGFFMTADDSEALLVRAKKIYGGAIPSGNAVFAMNLLRLSRMTGKTAFEDRYHALIKAFSGDVSKGPWSFPLLLWAVDFDLDSSKEIVIAGARGSEDLGAMLAAVREPFLPNKVVLFREDSGEGSLPEITSLAAFTEGQVSQDGKATAYVCENFACKLPTTDIATMLRSLGVEE